MVAQKRKADARLRSTSLGLSSGHESLSTRNLTVPPSRHTRVSGSTEMARFHGRSLQVRFAIRHVFIGPLLQLNQDDAISICGIAAEH